jgi:hypothetical protein
MTCPGCRSGTCKRSRREGSRDFLFRLIGLRPWRCCACERRFFAWSVAPRYLQYAHCRHCGNLGVKRISSEYVIGFLSGLLRTLHLPAYRCAACRYKFFSVRRRFSIVPVASSRAAESPMERSGNN